MSASSGAARRPMAAGNWKMNLDRASARRLVDALLAASREVLGVDVLVAPPSLLVPEVSRWVAGTGLMLAAQNMHWERKGAFTGEVSGPMLREAGCTHVILGHSERRHVFGEPDDWVGRKVGAALACELRPILCVGEKLDEREAGRTLEVVRRQLDAGLEGVDAAALARVIVAYEPVWAIGTGRTATPADAAEVHRAIRSMVAGRLGSSAAGGLRILYGGSVTPATIEGLISDPDIDGTLVGGASLDPDSFVKIVRSSAMPAAR